MAHSLASLNHGSSSASTSNEAADAEWRDRILNAIGKVRTHKQKPNMERLATVLRQVRYLISV